MRNAIETVRDLTDLFDELALLGNSMRRFVISLTLLAGAVIAFIAVTIHH